MRFPLSWIKDYVDFEDTLEGLSDKLTFSGLEVENIETVGVGLGAIVVGEVREAQPHPNADRLMLCAVFDGQEEYPVVCGAPNVQEGMKSAFASAGTTLPNGMKLKKTKIRGEISLGMLCAEDELGISKDHTGILELDNELLPGTPLEKLYGPPDTVFEVEVTPNRPDCLSIIGIARELAALYGATLKKPIIDYKETGKPIEQLTSVDVEDPKGCPRYTARILTNVKIGPSPTWMQRRLKLCNIRPINNVVDITNYVLLEYGQPLHAFDQSFLNEGRIVVRKAKPGETLETLDDTARALSLEHLVIADAVKPVAVAGVMGGANSEIHDATNTVLLESAYFNPSQVRATSKKLEMSTESSYRFSRGVDIGAVDEASRRAAQLLVEHAEASATHGVVDSYPNPIEKRRLACSWKRAESLIGIGLPQNKIRILLEAIEIHILDHDKETLRVEIPTFRNDLERDVDLIEEIARLYGLDKIPVPYPRAEIVPGADDAPIQKQRELRNLLVGLGLQEIINYSLTSSTLLDMLDPENADLRIILPHPISQDQSILRTSLIPQMMETLGNNKAHQNDEAALFEMGRVFHCIDDKYHETLKLCVGLMGPVNRFHFQKHQPILPDEMYAWCKGVFEALGVSPNISLVPEKIRHHWRISSPVAIAEVDVMPILENRTRRKTMKTPATFPSSSRDIALVVDRDVTHKSIVKVIQDAAPQELENAQLFDLFQDRKLGLGKKSLAYSLTFRAAKRTLTDEEVSAFYFNIVTALQKKIGAEIRDH